jgi:nucleoside-diphosphate-sugar epimerase
VRVFVAGATGVLGRPVVRRLVAAGHEVIGLTRSRERAEALLAAGAVPSVADALDAQEIRAAVLAARPDAVLHLLTSLSGRAMRRPSELAQTNALRTTGTRYLLDAASAAGARRFVAESMVFAYGYADHGERPLAEEDPPAAPHRDREVQAVAEALRALEGQVAEASRAFRVEGVSVRLGLFYGPGASDRALAALRHRALPVPAGGGVAPVVDVEDAAAAIVAALERGRAGEVYNAADADAPALGELFRALAEAAGAPPPRAVPMWLARLAAPLAAALFETHLRVTSERARRELGWAPRRASWREGVRALGTGRPGAG